MPLLVQRAALLVALGLVACDGGGGSPTAPISPTSRGVSFFPAPVGDTSIGLRGSVSGTSLEVEIYAAGVEGLYGLSFELLFPANLLRYEDSGTGVFPSLQTREAGPGRLLVGVTHLGAVAGLNGSGTVTVVRFHGSRQRQRDLRLQHSGGLRQVRGSDHPELGGGHGRDRSLRLVAHSWRRGGWTAPVAVATVAGAIRAPDDGRAEWVACGANRATRLQSGSGVARWNR